MACPRLGNANETVCSSFAFSYEMVSGGYSEDGQLILDKSGNNNHAVNGASLSAEPEDATP